VTRSIALDDVVADPDVGTVRERDRAERRQVEHEVIDLDIGDLEVADDPVVLDHEPVGRDELQVVLVEEPRDCDAAERRPGEVVVDDPEVLENAFGDRDKWVVAPIWVRWNGGPVFIAAFPQIKEAAANAQDYWNRVNELSLAIVSGKNYQELNPAEAAALITAIHADKRFKKLEPTLRSVVTSVLARPGGRAPTITAFAAIVERSVTTLTSLASTYAALIPATLASEGELSTSALQLGYVVRALSYFINKLRTYDHAGDVKAEEKHRADFRLAVQIRVADDAKRYGERMGLATVTAAADAFFRSGTYLALLSEFVPDEEVNSGPIQKDRWSKTFTRSSSATMAPGSRRRSWRTSSTPTTTTSSR
jgi:hypothetical protein